MFASVGQTFFDLKDSPSAILFLLDHMGLVTIALESNSAVPLSQSLQNECSSFLFSFEKVYVFFPFADVVLDVL